MTCEEAQQRLLEGAPAGEAALAEHLRRCPECAELAALSRELSRLGAGVRGAGGVSRRVRETILRRGAAALRRGSGRRPLAPRRVLLAAVLGAAAALVVVFSIRRPPEPAAPPADPAAVAAQPVPVAGVDDSAQEIETLRQSLRGGLTSLQRRLRGDEDTGLASRIDRLRRRIRACAGRLEQESTLPEQGCHDGARPEHVCLNCRDTQPSPQNREVTPCLRPEHC